MEIKNKMEPSVTFSIDIYSSAYTLILRKTSLKWIARFLFLHEHNLSCNKIKFRHSNLWVIHVLFYNIQIICCFFWSFKNISQCIHHYSFNIKRKFAKIFMYANCNEGTYSPLLTKFLLCMVKHFLGRLINSCLFFPSAYILIYFLLIFIIWKDI